MLTSLQEEKIRKYFRDQPVELVYLFGSQTSQKITLLSDYDFAVLFKDDLTKKQKFNLRLEYIARVGKILVAEKINNRLGDFEEFAQEIAKFFREVYLPKTGA